MTDLAPALIAAMLVVPLLGAAARAARAHARAGGPLRDRRRDPDRRARRACSPCIALSRGGSAPLRGQWYLARRRQRRAARRDRGRRSLQRARLAGLPAHERAQLDDRGPLAKPLLRGAVRLLGGAPRGPVAGNLAVVWLIVEATTAASALLVAFTGRRDALEAGWKYLVLTTLGLSVALLGIVVLAIGQASAGRDGIHALDWHALRLAAHALPKGATLIAFVLLLAGLATKIGWAPVHNWLPDAHSEAPPPISAMLSAALLPTVLLIAWRVKQILEPSVGAGTTRAVFIAFGLASIVIAIPFLWQALPWKRLLAYSSLEHMGVIALGIGFGTPLAIAGVVLHVAGHALAKSLGFYAAQPLSKIDPKSSTRAPSGVAGASPSTATAMGVSLAALAGLPPSPLFLSELLIVLGGVQAGLIAVSAVAVIALALGFLGLLHALIEGVIGERPRQARRRARAWPAPDHRADDRPRRRDARAVRARA